jgi:toxin ParE1/3/4
VKRFEVAYRPSAVRDLTDIYEWIAASSSSPVIANLFIQRLYDAGARIGEMPYGGRQRDDLMPGLRTIAFERKAVIAYVVTQNTVTITNVFYGGRDFEAMYRDARITDAPE